MRYLHTLDWDEIRDLLESQDPEDEPEGDNAGSTAWMTWPPRELYPPGMLSDT